MFGPEKNGFLFSPLDFDAVGLDIRVIFQRLMDYAAVESAERFQFHNVTPAADFFRGFLCFPDQGFAGLGAVTAHVHHDLWR